MKIKNRENLYAMFKFYWRQKQQQAAAQYMKTILLHEDKKLEQEHPDICDEELKVISSLFFSCQWMITYKKIKHKESEHN